MNEHDEILPVIDAAIRLEKILRHPGLSLDELFGENNHPNSDEMDNTRAEVLPAMTANRISKILVCELEEGGLRQRHPLTGEYVLHNGSAGRNALVSLNEAQEALKRHGMQFIEPAAQEQPPTAGTVTQQSEQVAPTAAIVIRQKIRTDALDAPIKKAIQGAGSLNPSAVFAQLKELAIAGELPFSGFLDGSALLYTDDDNKPARLTKGSLGKRLQHYKPRAPRRT